MTVEKRDKLNEADEWMQLRETRNIVTHEYPFVTDEIIQGLNLLSEHYLLITNIWKQTESYIKTRFKSEK